MAYTTVAVCVLLLKYEVDHDDIVFDNRMGSWPKLWNCDRLSYPTKFTSNLTKILVMFYVISCIWLSLTLTMNDNSVLPSLAEGNISTVILVCVPSVTMIVSMVFLVRQPKSQKKLAFSVPFMPWFPALSILINIYLLTQLGFTAWVRFSVWIAFGLLIYFGYGRRNSKMNEAQIIAENEISENES
jgi:L-asparagine transporter-like permease